MKKIFLGVIVSLLCFTSCKTSENINYLQDVTLNQPEKIASGNKDITLQAHDKILIHVSSKDPQLAALFNLSSDNGNSSGSGKNSYGYTLDENGDIDFPVVGTINVLNLTKGQVAKLIKNRLINEDLIKDPVVTVEFMNLTCSVLGEVSHPGQYNIENDQFTILDAVSMAGDLTIFGKRDGVIVIREENGMRTTYNVDLRSKNLFDSPVYYLHQNDVVYVQPNNVRAGQSTINENSVKSVPMWMSIASFIMSLSVFLFK